MSPAMHATALPSEESTSVLRLRGTAADIAAEGHVFLPRRVRWLNTGVEDVADGVLGDARGLHVGGLWQMTRLAWKCECSGITGGAGGRQLCERNTGDPIVQLNLGLDVWETGEPTDDVTDRIASARGDCTSCHADSVEATRFESAFASSRNRASSRFDCSKALLKEDRHRSVTT
mmetsp:Transcript_8659/g.24143  ORF Transcript_8659/g.24143 Transcript_8659/m.24143 type:complete len:175 (-) Transcript_8659:1372-1896(-)